MAKITIREVETKKELKKFIRFNYELYKDNPYSVPDLYEDMLNTFSDKNAAMEFCKAKYFLAYNEKGEIGFLNDLRRMNVAITRARMKLIILGNAATLTRHPFYKQLFDYISTLDA